MEARGIIITPLALFGSLRPPNFKLPLPGIPHPAGFGQEFERHLVLMRGDDPDAGFGEEAQM